MKIQYWVITHRVLFRRMGILLLMAFDIAIVWFGVMGWSRYWGTKDEYDRMVQQLAQQSIAIPQEEIQPLIIEKVAVVPNTENKYDLAALVKNPNTRWFVGNLNYQFVVDGVSVDTGSTFVMAGEEKVIAKVGLVLDHKPGTVNLSFDKPDVSWSRVKGDTNFAAQLPNFKISDISWMPIVDQKLAPFSRLNANITNDGIDSFWSVDIYALVLDSGDNIVGVGYSRWDNAFAGVKHQIVMSWDTIISQGSKIAIYPDLNVTDPANIKR